MVGLKNANTAYVSWYISASSYPIVDVFCTALDYGNAKYTGFVAPLTSDTDDLILAPEKLFIQLLLLFQFLSGPKCDSTKATIGVDITLPNFCTKSHQRALKGDFNGDGHVDILCHDSKTGWKWISYGSNGVYSGIGWERAMSWCWHRGSSLYVGDFNGDNRTDILCHDGRRVWISYANNAGAFVETNWDRVMNFCECAGCKLCIADVNKDGKSDMVCHERAGLIAYATVDGNFENN